MSLPSEITHKFTMLRDNTYEQIGIEKGDAMGSLVKVFRNHDLAQRNSLQGLAGTIHQMTQFVDQNKLSQLIKESSIKEEKTDNYDYQAVESAL